MASRSITDCTEELQKVWYAAKEKYEKLFPKLAQPFLTCTHRSNEEQDSLYNQPTDGIDNDKDGKIDESDEKVTNCKAGQSYHNFNPSKAFDVGMKTSEGKLDWSTENFKIFANIVKSINPKVIWGGNFKKFKDYPHFELH